MVKAMNTVLNLPARATQVCHPHRLLPLSVNYECGFTMILPRSSSHLCILLQIGEQGWGSDCRWRQACMASRWQALCLFPRQGTSPPCSGAAPSSCRRCAALVALWDGHSLATFPALNK